MTASDFIGDREAAEIFGISPETLRRHCMESFVPRRGTIDIRLARPVKIGRSRRWYVANIENLLKGI